MSTPTPDLPAMLADCDREDLRLADPLDYSVLLRQHVRTLSAIITKHNLCHDLHGKVGRDEFEEGCRQETVKEFGSCGWADRIRELKAAAGAKHDALQEVVVIAEMLVRNHDITKHERREWAKQIAEHKTALASDSGRAILDELAKSEKACEEVMAERDAREDQIVSIHVALGGDGEWVAHLPSQTPPESGDLGRDCEAMAIGLCERLAKAESEVEELREAIELQTKAESAAGAVYEAQEDELAALRQQLHEVDAIRALLLAERDAARAQLAAAEGERKQMLETLIAADRLCNALRACERESGRLVQFGKNGVGSAVQEQIKQALAAASPAGGPRYLHGMRLGKALCGWAGKQPEEGELTSEDECVTCPKCRAAGGTAKHCPSCGLTEGHRRDCSFLGNAAQDAPM